MKVQAPMSYIVLRMRIKGRQHSRLDEKIRLVRADEVNAGLGSVIPDMSGLFDELLHVA